MEDGFIDGLKRDRNCDGSVIFRSLTVINNENDNSFRIKMGDPLILKLDIEFIKNIETFFIIEVLLNQNNIIYASPRIPVSYRNLNSKNRKSFNFSIDNFNLNEGMYYLKIMLGTNKVKHDVIWQGLPPLKISGKEKQNKKLDGVFDFRFSFKEIE